MACPRTRVARKVSYSIGLSGTYALHVRLRQQALPIPGSPFLLTVDPAPAHGHRSTLPTTAIRGRVGGGSENGCETTLATADKMGNLCIRGGAKVARAGPPTTHTAPALAHCRCGALFSWSALRIVRIVRACVF